MNNVAVVCSFGKWFQYCYMFQRRDNVLIDNSLITCGIIIVVLA